MGRTYLRSHFKRGKANKFDEPKSEDLPIMKHHNSTMDRGCNESVLNLFNTFNLHASPSDRGFFYCIKIEE